MANTIGWGQAVLNLIGWGADGSRNALETTNLISENSDFFITQSGDFLIDETLFNSGGFGAVYDVSYSGETLLER
jgi:hypothetical protein